MKIGLFFGSYNPVHVGHLIIANYMVEHTDLDQVWMVVSPQNPFKQKKNLAKDYDRLHLVHLAIGDNSKIKASDIEFGLPKPSYTVDTLAYLYDKYPDQEFALLMGGDNLPTFPKWKNYEQILKHHQLYVYNRPGYEPGELADHPQVKRFDAPLMQISASFIRKQILSGKSIQYLVSEPIRKYIENSNVYGFLSRNKE
ncbi:MAG: nicotinate (nicotinamide) nucleotide adenylyltransferase [Bacteroidota bacterium]